MTPETLESKLLKRLKAHALVQVDNTEANPLIIRSTRGRKLKWLFDLRSLLTQSDDLDLIATVFWDRMEAKWPFQVGGLEVGAIPLVAAIVMKGRERGFKVNSFIVRKTRKKAGLCKQIEGTLNQDPVVVVDDLMNSGRSMQRVIAAIEQAGANVAEAFVFIDFKQAKAADFLAEKNITFEAVYQLSDFSLSVGPDALFFPTKNTIKVDWVFSPPAPNYTVVMPHSAPVFDEEKIYYGADNGYFYAVNKRSGAVVWEFQTGESIKGIVSSPVLTETGVIFGAYDGSVYHLDREHGGVIWEAPIAEYVGSSPCLAPDLGLVFVGLEHNLRDRCGSLVALDLETGEKVWEHFTEQYMHSTPAYCAQERLVTVGSNDGLVLLLDAKTGAWQWNFKMGGPLKAAPTFDLARRQVIAPSFDKNCYGIDIDSGQERWRFTAGHAFYNTALIFKDRLFIGGCDKFFYLYDLKNNKLIKRIETLGRILSHPQVIDNTIWFGSNDGGVRQIDIDGNYLGGVYLPERVLTPIVYDETLDRYFVVTAGNHLLCLKPIEANT